MIKVILIHGNEGGTKNDHWFPYIKHELEKAGIKVIAETFPDNHEARSRFWLPYIKELGADGETIIIGHSSGAVAAMRFAEGNMILGSVLVGAGYTDLGEPLEKQSGYYDQPWDWETIRNNQKWIVQFASTDDPFVPVAEARFIHQKLRTEYYEYTNQGHFGIPQPKPEFPEIIEVVKKRLLKN